MDVLGPSDGGAAYGTYIRIFIGAGGGVNGTGNNSVSHQIDFPNMTGFADGSTPSYAWRRRTNNVGPSGLAVGVANWTCSVPSQRRIYLQGRASASPQPIYWFDLATDTYVTGTNSNWRANNGDSPDTGIMFHVPSRSLVIFADSCGGNLRLQYMDVSQAQPGWVTSVTLSQTLPVVADFSCACWCPDNNRIIVGAASGDNAAVYEIEIPATLSNPWNMVRAPFGGGQTIGFVGSPTYKKWSYNSKVRAIVYMPYAAGLTGDDMVWVYRPRNT